MRLFLFLSFCYSQVFASAQSLDSGLVLCLPINNEVIDKVGNRSITSFGYTFTTDRKNRVNEAIKFNGTTDYLEVDSFGNFVPEDEITISFWAKTEEVKSHFVCVLMPNDPENRLSIVVNYLHGGGSKFHFWDVQNTSLGRLGVTPILEDNNWHFYTFTNSLKLGEMCAYKDGVLLQRKYTNVSVYRTQRNLRIGKGDIPGSNFHGSIDEFRIYDRVLTLQEIQLLQNFNGCDVTSDTTDIDNWSLPCITDFYEISPNPAISLLKIKVLQACPLNGTANLYNAVGQLVSTTQFEGNKAQFFVETLSVGTYFVQIKNEYGELLASRKVLIGI